MSETDVNHLDVTGGSLDADGLLQVDQTFNFTGGTLWGDAGIELAGTVIGTMSGSNYNEYSSTIATTLTNHGTLTWDSEYAVNLGARIDTTGNYSYEYFGGTLLNHGTLELTSDARLNDLSSEFDYDTDQEVSLSLLDNRGTIIKTGVDSSSFTVSEFNTPINSSGDFQILDGNLEISGVGTVSGDIYLATGSELELSPASSSYEPSSDPDLTFTSTAAITGQGIVEASSGNILFQGSLDAAQLDVTGADLDVTESVFIDVVRVQSGSIQISGNVNSLELTGGELSGVSDLTIGQSLLWSGGKMDGVGSTILATSATGMLTGNSTKILDREFRNQGHVEWTGGDFQLDDEFDQYNYVYDEEDDADSIRFVNLFGAVFDIIATRRIVSGAQVEYDPLTGTDRAPQPPIIENHGLVVNNVQGELYVQSVFENYGVFDLGLANPQSSPSGDLTSNQTFLYGGLVTHPDSETIFRFGASSHGDRYSRIMLDSDDNFNFASLMLQGNVSLEAEDGTTLDGIDSLTLIENYADSFTNQIAGEFVDLPQGEPLILGGNLYYAFYNSDVLGGLGDGNDLELISDSTINFGADTVGDTRNTAQPLNVVTGETTAFAARIGDGVYGRNDVDMFSATLTRGQRIIVDVQTPISQLDAEIRVFDPNGDSVATTTVFDGSSGDKVSFNVTLDGLYFIGISGRANDDYDLDVINSGSGGNSIGTFELNITAEDPTADTVGDSIQAARRLTVAPGTTTTFDARIGDGFLAGNDVDVFWTELLPGQVLTATVATPGSNLDATLRLFQEDGTELAIDQGSGPNGNPQISYTVVHHGRYYIGVSSSPNDEYNPLTIDSGSPGTTLDTFTIQLDATEVPLVGEADLHARLDLSEPLSPTGNPIDFGNTVFGSPRRRAFYVHNSSDYFLRVQSIDVPDGYRIIGSQSNVLVHPQSTVGFVIELEAFSLGDISGDVIVRSSDLDEPVLSFPITGFVAQADLDAQNDTFTGIVASESTRLTPLTNDDGVFPTIVDVSGHPGVSIADDGTTLLFQTDPGFGQAVLTYTISDGFSQDTAEITLQENLAPVAVDDHITHVIEGGTHDLSVIENDADIDGDSLSIVAVSAPTAGSVVNMGTYLVYTAGEGFSGDNLTYTIQDAAGNQATATVNLSPPAQPSGVATIDFDRLTDVTTSVDSRYLRTSFVDQSRELHAELLLENVGTFGIRGPILMGVRNIDRPDVLPLDVDGFTPNGMPYYDVTEYLTDDQFDLFSPGEVSSERFDLAFDVPSRDPFTYDLVFLAFLNEAPVFETTPVTSVRPGATYVYDSGAVDPDSDPVTYRLAAGPAGMQLFATSGLIQWTTTGADIGNHSVVIEATDPYGATAQQVFTISVEDSGNRPPLFTSTPVADAHVGEVYVYDVDAIDPDGDVVQYTLIDGPEGLEMLPDERGVLRWDPPSSLGGQVVTATVLAEDAMGGQAVQTFDIYVHPDPLNLPPVIITEPDLEHVVAAFPGQSVGDVNPDAIHLELGPGQSIDIPVVLGTQGDEAPSTLPGLVPDQLVVRNTDDAIELLDALLATGNEGIVVTDVNLAGQFRGPEANPTHLSSGIFLNDTDIYGLSPYGIVLSSGNAEDYGQGPDSTGSTSTSFGTVATPEQADILRPISGNYTFYDVTQFDVTFELDPEFDAISFEVVFGSEEFPEWVNSSYIDGFGLLVNGRNVAFANDEAVNINHPDFRTAPGTELDGVIIAHTTSAPGTSVDAEHATQAVMQFVVPITPGSETNTVTFITSDASDGIYDTTAYISGLTGALANPVELDANADLAGKPFVNQTGVVTGVLPGANAYFDNTISSPDGTGDAFNILITDANDGALEGSIPVTLNTGYFYPVRAIDPDGDAITYALVDGPEGASIDPESALVSWVPPAPGDYDFTIRVDDGRGGVDTQAFTVTVSDSADLTNNGPTLQDIDDVVADVNRPIAIQAVGDDIDGDALKYYLSGAPEGLGIDTDTGLITWTPSLEQSGLTDHPVTVSVLDRRGGVASVDFNVTVNDFSVLINNAPVITSAPVTSVAAGSEYRYDVDAIDPDFDPVSYGLVFGPTGMAIDSTTGELVWNPTREAIGTHNVYVTVEDSRGGDDYQIFQLTVAAENQPPVFTSLPSIAAVPSEAWTYTPTATDPDGDAVSYRLLSGPLGMQFDGPALSYTPDSHVASFRFTIEADDGLGGTAQQTVEVFVQQNAPPEITSQPEGTWFVGDTFVYDVVTSDADGDTVTLSLDDSSLARGVQVQGHQITWPLTADGEFEIAVTASDGQGGTAQQIVTLPVYQQVVDSLPPEFTSTPSGPIYTGTPWHYDFAATDPDGDDSQITYALVAPVAGAAGVQLTGQRLTWTADSPTALEFTIRATDEAGVSTDQTFTARAIANRIGSPPVIHSVPVGPAVRGTAYTYQVDATDADGDTLRYAVTDASGTLIDGLSIDSDTGLLTYATGSVSSVTMHITVSDVDAQGNVLDGSTVQVFTLPIVDPPGSIPRITSTPVGPAITGQPWQYTVTTTDIDDDSITYALESFSSNTGSATPVFSGDTLTWTPSADDVELTVTVSASDVDGTRTQTFTIASVPPIDTGNGNAAPVFTSTPRGPVLVGQQWTYFARANDPDGDAVTYSLPSPDSGLATPEGMTIDAATGRLQWTPDATGDYPITITASDSLGAATPQTFTLSVDVSNVAPEITSNPEGPITVGRQWSYTLTATDANDAPESLTFAMLQPTANGDLVFDATTATVTWTPADTSPVNFVFAVTDPQGASSTQSFTVTPGTATGAPNRAPIITSVPTGPAVLGETFEYQVVATDQDGDDLTYTLNPSVPGATLNADGLLQFTVASLAPQPFVIEVSDGNGGLATQAFTLEVRDSNDLNLPPRFITSPVGPAIVGEQWTYTPDGQDPENDDLTILFTETSSLGSVWTGTQIQWQPASANDVLTGDVTITDSAGNVVTQSISISAIDQPTNDPGNSRPRFVTTPQGGAVVGLSWSYDALAVDDDINDVITYSLDDAARAGGFAVDRNSGFVTWTPTSDGSATFTITADDGRGGIDQQIVSVPVANPNAAPRFTSTPTGPAVLGTAWTYAFNATDANDPDTSLVYELVSPSADANVVFDPVGRTLNWNAPAPDLDQSFTIRATDPQGASITQQFTIRSVANSDAVNSRPVFTSIPVTTVRLGEAYRYDADAFDADGDNVIFGLASAPIGMTIDAQSGQIVWTPPAIGSYDVVVSASDGNGPATLDGFTITVTPPVTTNDPPEITSTPSARAVRDTSWQYAATAIDPNGDVITWRIDTSSVPANAIGDLQVDSSTGLLTWTPTVAGSFTFDLFAADDQGAETGQRITLPVLENAPPRFESAPVLSVAQDSPYVYDSLAVDPNLDDVLTYSLDADSLARGLEVNAESGVVTWAANLTGTPGLYPVTLTVADDDGATDTQSFDLRVVAPAAPNQPPQIASTLSGNVQIGQRLIHDVMASDPDGDALTLSLIDAPAGMTIAQTGLLDWTPAASQNDQSFTFTVRADDGRGGVTDKPFALTVVSENTNSAPLFTSQPNTAAVAIGLYQYQATAIDPDGDTLRYTVSTGPEGIIVNPQTGLVQWIPTTAQIGDHDIQLSVADPRGGVDTQSFTITVGGANRPPAITSSPGTNVVVGQTYTYPVIATDPDNHTLTYSLGEPATNADNNGSISIDPDTGVLSWTPTSLGSHYIQIEVRDQFGLGTAQTFTVEVVNESTGGGGGTGSVNRAPFFVDGDVTYIARQGSPYSATLAAQDPDVADTLVFELANGPSGATIDTSTGELVWNVPADQPLGQVNFTLQVADRPVGDPDRETAEFNYGVFVNPANVAPWARDIDDQTIIAGNELAVDVWAFDANGDTITYTIDQASQDLGITIDPLGRIRWQTTADDVMPDGHQVLVQISDGFEADGGISDQKGFTVRVLADDTGPAVSLSASAGQVDLGTFVDVRLLAIDDVEVTSRTLTLASTTDPQGNTIQLDQPLSINDQGYARVEGSLLTLGTLTFLGTARDAAGNESTSAPLTVQVIDPDDNEGPRVDLLPIDGNLEHVADLVGTVLDDTVNVNWELTLSPLDSERGDWTSVIASGNGQVTTAERLGQIDATSLRNGSYLVTLTATDAGGNTATDSEPVNIDSELKLGNFSLSFTDLSIPVSGIPITVTRTYDTLEADVSGDFGYGWDLDFNMPTMTVVRGSTGATNFSGYASFVNGTRVLVTTPEGNQEGFTFAWVQAGDGLGGIGLSRTYRPSFTPDPGNEYTLIPPGQDVAFRRLTVDGPYQDDSGRLYSAQDPYFGGVYQLKQSDPRGRQLDYDILVGDRGTVEMTAHRVKDKYGNAFELQPDGIFGQQVAEDGTITAATRNVSFVRDWQGRITQIIDPRGGELNYRYDSLGRLTEFHDRRASERLNDSVEGNEFEPTRFVYDIEESIRRNELALGTPIEDEALQVVISQLPGADNYLSQIIDPLGVDALLANYGRDGRLGGLVDAEGNPSQLEYEIGPDGATVSSETTEMNQTQSAFDRFNRLIRETSASGQVTIYTYLSDAENDDYPYQTIQVIGAEDGPEAWADTSIGDDRVTTRLYHQEFDGAVTQETDADGNTVLTAYNTWGYNKGTPSTVYNLSDGTSTDYHWFDLTGNGQLELVTQTDSYGNTTQYGYDTFGNVSQLTQINEFVGSSTTTGFTYDTFGDLVEVIDQDGNVRGISYNENGDQTGTLFYHYPTDQRPPVVDEATSPSTQGYTAADFPITRTKLRTENEINFAGDVTGSRTYVTEQTLDPATLTYIDGETTVRNESGTVEFDAIGRAFRTTDENGRTSETIFDARGLAIETRSESPTENGSGTWLISRTVYDTEGRAVYSTGSFPEDVFTNSPDQITGTYSIYDGKIPVTFDLDGNGTIEADETFGGAGTGRMLASVQLLGLDIDLVGQAASLSSALTSAGSVVSFSRSFYDDNDRVIETENDYGLRSQTLYDDNSRVIESRSEVVASDGTRSWMVSRTIYDTEGKVTASTDRFLVPGDTPLGEDPASGPVITQITQTIYDDRDRSIATERYIQAIVAPASGEALATGAPHPGFEITNPGTLESVSETLYDEASRVFRTISGRIPVEEVATQDIAAAQSLYATYGSDTDRYADLNLSSGVISDTLFDDRGRQIASLGHPLPAEEVGMGDAYPGLLIRHRSETEYNGLGQAFLSRGGLAQVENPDGTLVAIVDDQSIDMQSTFDAFGNVVRVDYVTGGTISGGTSRVGGISQTSTRTGGVSETFTQTRFDDENRPIAEMQQTSADINAVWDETLDSFVIDGTSTTIPTKLYHYDSDDQLEGVSLGYVDPQDSSLRPRYSYSYDERGNQTSSIDPLGRETRFTFTDRGQQATRTLPLGQNFTLPLGGSSDSEGRAGMENAFTEAFFYDDRGRQSHHTSFEGIVTENVYDDYGRMSAMNYYASKADFDAGLVSERDEYTFDAYGRRAGWTRYTVSEPTALAAGDSAADDTNFTASRTEVMGYDNRSRLLFETSPEGVLSYGYDSAGRMTHTAINADPAVVDFVNDPYSYLPADATTAERVTLYGYDILGRLVSVTEDATPGDGTDEAQTETTYGFDLQGRQRSMQTFTGNNTVPTPSILTVMRYDSLGRLDVMTDFTLPPGGSSVSEGRVTASYDYEVRADGRRTSSTETFWIDENEDGELTANELKANSYSWTYDGLNRLTDEVIDHWDDAFDQTESFEYDLTGNRTSKTLDKGNDGTVDESVDYRYDANDRLFAELSNDLTATDADATTIYGYDHTQQTAKTVYADLLDDSTIEALIAGDTLTSPLVTRSSQLFTYNLQGRMSEAVIDKYNTDGTLESRERSSYEYDMRSFRVGKVLEKWNEATSSFDLASSTSYLASHRNHTGYAQTLREMVKDADGNVIKTTDYTIGSDEIAQTVTENGETTTLVYGHDGHGSVRVLYDLSESAANLIEQIATYSAYGVMIAMHSGNGIASPITEFMSTLTYSGEAWDNTLNKGYNRARWYDASSGQWNRLDPFVGNIQDPQSLHKYAYVHGDPIGGIDPSGLVKVKPWVTRWITRIGLSAAYYILFGWLAEYTIAQQYLLNRGRGLEDVKLGVPLGRNNDPDLPPGGNTDQFRRNKPDIVDKGHRTYYEIKSGSPFGIAKGLKQLKRYDDAVAARWPGQNYKRGTWAPSPMMLWLKAPIWISGDTDLPINIELPTMILTYRHSPGLVVYDPYTLMTQSLVWGYATEKIVTKAITKIITRMGGPRTGSSQGIQEVVDEIFTTTGPSGGSPVRLPNLPGSSPTSPTGTPVHFSGMSFSFTFSVGGFSF
ncbi:putative Ig domain-containing protein [Aporhodopirellula rubra]|uniref:putative Ig domain-containing protein n=1 Tax=Aporhodopirellula rubra TaxID=980271 RepID=UPI001C842221|nr:putative Ig domain-containing protein [Aporhodopirellula rubra]